MAYTKGPWKIISNGKRIYVDTDINGPLIGLMLDHEEIADDARLIAAAPDLLEACKDALEELEQDDGYSGSSLVARLAAAIEKATGSG